MRPIFQFALVTLLLAGNDGCAHRSPQPGDSRGLYGNSIVIKGSDTMVLLAQWWVENYLKSHPHLIIQVNGGGSGTGIAALLNGTTDICQSSRPIKEQERAAFRTKYRRDAVEIKVALDAIGVYVNEANPLAAELRTAQIQLSPADRRHVQSHCGRHARRHAAGLAWRDLHDGVGAASAIMLPTYVNRSFT